MSFARTGRVRIEWNKLISDHAKCGRGIEALSLYEEMRGEGMIPNKRIFLSALKACSIIPSLQACKQIHGNLIQSGCETDMFLASTLVDAYAKCGSIEDACLVFDEMRSRDVVSWTALISGYAHMEMHDLALQLYARMQHEGFIPTPHTFVTALKSCGNLAAEGTRPDGGLEQGRAIHAQLVQNGLESQIFVASALVDMYAKCGSIEDACSVFERMQCRDVVTWNTIITGFVQLDMGHLALKFYKRMRWDGFKPNARTFAAVLKACSSLASQDKLRRADVKLLNSSLLEQGRAIHAELVQRGFESDIFVGSTLVDMYAKCGSIQDACTVFEKMRHRDVVAWNAMIIGYVHMGMEDSALKLYAHMQHEGLKPNAHTFVAALKACSCMSAQEDDQGVNGELLRTSCLEQGRAIHAELARRGLESNIFVANTLLDMYAKCGSMEDAHLVFEKMRHRSIVSWTTMIIGYTQTKMAHLALKSYAEMRQEGFQPDAAAFVAALKACCSLTSLEIGRDIHSQIYKAGMVSELSVVNSLVDMYGKCGSMVDAQQLFDSLQVRNSVTWSALIAGYSGQGNTKCVFDFYNRMQKEGIEADATTFVSVLTTCSHNGLVDKGQMHFQAMRVEYAISPSTKHFMCMVNLLGRAGKLDEAVTVLKNMPFKPDTVTWKNILGACRTWNLMEIGKYAFECALMLDERFAAAHVLMINMYASASMWEES